MGWFVVIHSCDSPRYLIRERESLSTGRHTVPPCWLTRADCRKYLTRATRGFHLSMFRRIAALLFAAVLFVVLVAACASPTATPVPPTATPVPPTATPVPPTARRLFHRRRRLCRCGFAQKPNDGGLAGLLTELKSCRPDISEDTRDLANLLLMLEKFREDPEFHRVGFGVCCRFNAWLKEAELLRDRADTSSSLEIGLVPGEVSVRLDWST